MFHSLSSLVPNAADLLALEVEELAGVLLMHLNSYEGVHGNSVYQNGQICQSNFLNAQTPTGHGQRPEYGDQQPQVNRALMEAWSWLQSESFLIRDPAQQAPWFFVSRRAQRLKSRDDFEAYRKASLLPKGQLHPLLASKVYPAFLRGDYDTAIFQAFKEVEVAVRQAGSFPHDLVGDKLMRAAFATAKNNLPAGPLTDTQLPVGEQEATAHLFAGAFGVYRNSTGHRHVPTEAVETAEVIMFASQLLRIVDRLKPRPAGGKP
jgi:uncharacterized protein (TIGR02391 family)